MIVPSAPSANRVVEPRWRRWESNPRNVPTVRAGTRGAAAGRGREGDRMTDRRMSNMMTDTPLSAVSMTDEEFKEKVVRSYNRCAAEHKRYRTVLELIASGDWVEADPLAIRDMAREALREVKDA